MKKFTSILLCSIACVIQFAHSAVPHTHAAEHEHEHSGHSHHHHHHDEDRDTEDKSLFVHFFSHFGHSAEVIANHQIEDVKIAQADVLQPVFVGTKSSVRASFAVETRLPQKAFDEPDIYISPHLLSFQFRGPPSV